MHIGGVTIDFPFTKPYQSQIQVMSKTIGALKNKENGLLESPTGSGKTMALLCASLAWQKSEREKEPVEGHLIPKIYYGTRTHRQIKQIIKVMFFYIINTKLIKKGVETDTIPRR